MQRGRRKETGRSRAREARMTVRREYILIGTGRRFLKGWENILLSTMRLKGEGRAILIGLI